MSDIKLKITDRDGKSHNVMAPIDMAMNLMEVIRSYELAPWKHCIDNKIRCY